MENIILETKELTKTFGGITAVDGVDFRLEEGERVGIIGPNGAGKTTFFNLLNRLFLSNGGKNSACQSGDKRYHEYAAP